MAAGTRAGNALLTLTYMRRNGSRQKLPRTTVSATISRAISELPHCCASATHYVPRLMTSTRDVLHRGRHPAPVLVWRAHPELYSGKHKTTGMNVQVACTITGCLAWISTDLRKPHDNHSSANPGSSLFDSRNWLGDKGYVGNNMITPSRSLKAANCWIGRRSSISRSTRSVTSSNRSSRTSRPGGSCHTDYATAGTFPETSQQLSPALLRNRLNNPPCTVAGRRPNVRYFSDKP